MKQRRGTVTDMDWAEARAAICNRATESDNLQRLWESLHEAKHYKEAREMIKVARDTAASMLDMLDQWVKTSEEVEK